ncbi:MAG: hypothetical protein J5610_03345 [Prevotella sp.]|nr:hypothetical protein [Prevotella sp.]
MKIKWIMLSCLSAAFVALGFGSCNSKKALTKQQQREALAMDEARLNSEIQESQARLMMMRQEYENIGRGECVYGGPNTMEQAIAEMNRRQEAQRAEMRTKMAAVEHSIDSLFGEHKKVEQQIHELNKKK